MSNFSFRGHNFSNDVKLQVMSKTGNRCFYCGVELEHGYYTVLSDVRNQGTIDHIVPKSKGGSDGLENLVPACRSCNAKKGNRT